MKSHTDGPLMCMLYKAGRTTSARVPYAFVDGWSGPYPLDVARRGVGATGAHLIRIGTQRDVVNAMLTAGLLTQDERTEAFESVVIEVDEPYADSSAGGMDWNEMMKTIHGFRKEGVFDWVAEGIAPVRANRAQAEAVLAEAEKRGLLMAA